jgi:hypothetical protein
MVRAVFVILDALPPRWVSDDVTPTLMGLAHCGGWARAGVPGVLTAATYPNHATFATGTAPAEHGVVGNRLWRKGRMVDAAVVGPAGDTVFDRLAAQPGRTSAAVLGDHHLVGVMGAAAAGWHWPPGGALPGGTPVDDYGYATDQAVLDALPAAFDVAADLTVVHFNGPDTAAHRWGPDSDAAVEQYRATDAALQQLLERCRPDWENTVVVVVSDHDQETVTNPEPIDAAAEVQRRGLGWVVLPEGSAAVLHPLSDEPLPALAGEAGRLVAADGSVIVWCEPGRYYGSAQRPAAPALAGVHGSPRTRSQVAVVGGGHPEVRRLAGLLDRGNITGASWAPLLLSLCGVDVPGN